ncbi:MAG: hypothetical protein K6E40_14410, partial [Desulfovibrio sp.]|nr:hypothetical protein [Desulfovibrio sp.]
MKNNLFPMEKNDEASMGPGCVQARNEGLTEGYAYGRTMGLAEGHAKGLAKGLKEGHRAGLKEGLAEGYGKGREDGLAEGQSKIIRLYLEATGFVAGTGAGAGVNPANGMLAPGAQALLNGVPATACGKGQNILPGQSLQPDQDLQPGQSLQPDQPSWLGGQAGQEQACSAPAADSACAAETTAAEHGAGASELAPSGLSDSRTGEMHAPCGAGQPCPEPWNATLDPDGDAAWIWPLPEAPQDGMALDGMAQAGGDHGEDEGKAPALPDCDARTGSDAKRQGPVAGAILLALAFGTGVALTLGAEAYLASGSDVCASRLAATVQELRAIKPGRDAVRTAEPFAQPCVHPQALGGEAGAGSAPAAGSGSTVPAGAVMAPQVPLGMALDGLPAIPGGRAVLQASQEGQPDPAKQILPARQASPHPEQAGQPGQAGQAEQVKQTKPAMPAGQADGGKSQESQRTPACQDRQRDAGQNESQNRNQTRPDGPTIQPPQTVGTLGASAGPGTRATGAMPQDQAEGIPQPAGPAGNLGETARLLAEAEAIKLRTRLAKEEAACLKAQIEAARLRRELAETGAAGTATGPALPKAGSSSELVQTAGSAEPSAPAGQAAPASAAGAAGRPQAA